VSYLTLQTGAKVYYQCYGQSGPVVIFLHGLASSHRIWARQIRAFKHTCQVYVLDFPGHGQSDWQQSYTIQDLSEVLKQFMDQRGIPTASLVAISMGCSVALTLASRYPGRVDKLVLEGPVGGYRSKFDPLGWPDRIVFLSLPWLLRLSIGIFGFHPVAHWINTFGVKAKFNFQVLEELQYQADFKAIQDLLWNSACTPYAGCLEKVQAPVLLLRGQQDPMPKRFVEYIRSHCTAVNYIEVPETRHLVAMERPAKFHTIVSQFLEPIR